MNLAEAVASERLLASTRHTYPVLELTGGAGRTSPSNAPATVDMQKLVFKEIDLRGTIAYVRDHAPPQRYRWGGGRTRSSPTPVSAATAVSS